MNHKAEAICSNGHQVAFGSCTAEKRKLFGGTKKCGSKMFDKVSEDVYQCIDCHAKYSEISCPTCNEPIPVSSFQKKSFIAKLG